MSTMQAVDLNKIRMEAYLLAVRFIELGGTKEAWLDAFLHAANEMPGEGQQGFASDGRSVHANARQPIPSEGHIMCAGDGQNDHVNARNPTTNGSGHTFDAKDGQSTRAAPVRGPSKSQVSAAGAARLAAARTVLDTCKTHDGRAWGNVGAHELDSMKRDGGLAKAIKDHVGQLSNSQRFLPVRDLITAKQFQKLLDKERANAA